VDKKSKISIKKVAFIQALGLIAYTSLVGMIMLNGNRWFGPMNKTPLLGPILFLTLFIMSALICALIAFTIPFRIFWDEKNTKEAIKMVVYETMWLALFVIIILTSLILLK
jgi:hypothetical protein